MPPRLEFVEIAKSKVYRQVASSLEFRCRWDLVEFSARVFALLLLTATGWAFCHTSWIALRSALGISIVAIDLPTD